MKVYMIVKVDSYGYIFLTNKCFFNKEKAQNYCFESNKTTYAYLQSCADNCEQAGNYTLFTIRELKVEE